jgi:phage shock protein C
MTEDRPDGIHNDSLTHDQRRARRPDTTVKFRRSRNKVIAGIAGGVANFVGGNPLIVRVIFVVALILTAGFFVLPYLLLWWLIPSEE